MRKLFQVSHLFHSLIQTKHIASCFFLYMYVLAQILLFFFSLSFVYRLSNQSPVITMECIKIWCSMQDRLIMATYKINQIKVRYSFSLFVSLTIRYFFFCIFFWLMVLFELRSLFTRSNQTDFNKMEIAHILNNWLMPFAIYFDSKSQHTHTYTYTMTSNKVHKLIIMRNVLHKSHICVKSICVSQGKKN